MLAYCKLVVEDSSNNLFHPVCDDGAESGWRMARSLAEIGQWAGGLLRTLSQRPTHFNKDEHRRCGCCLVSQTTCKQGPGAEEKRGISTGGHFLVPLTE